MNTISQRIDHESIYVDNDVDESFSIVDDLELEANFHAGYSAASAHAFRSNFAEDDPFNRVDERTRRMVSGDDVLIAELEEIDFHVFFSFELRVAD